MSAAELCVCGPTTVAAGFCECGAVPELTPLRYAPLCNAPELCRCGDPGDCSERSHA